VRAAHVAEGIDLDVVVDCSSGTYIRALARDLGAALGVGGHLTALRRTRIGAFEVATRSRSLRTRAAVAAEVAAAVLGALPVTAEERATSATASVSSARHRGWRGWRARRPRRSIPTAGSSGSSSDAVPTSRAR
jgi:tRNA U55 pseudouridine synthase TruB